MKRMSIYKIAVLVFALVAVVSFSVQATTIITVKGTVKDGSFNGAAESKPFYFDSFTSTLSGHTLIVYAGTKEIARYEGSFNANEECKFPKINNFAGGTVITIEFVSYDPHGTDGAVSLHDYE